ncbi:hypothetical protein AB6A40_005592 [Gnathostoma spinigerum]|uniref:phosphoribosylformylglycinamidine synthase n=1 Tax=Gnathostoma spinigerum TaxID=75299 RepID=A0ABD6EPG0_9BILA
MIFTVLQVIIHASNGASDYGNKFGEPVICGFFRSYGQRSTVNGTRWEYIKPIMFSGGIGSIDHYQIRKMSCRPGLLVAKIGGPAYRIGVGGGAASSVRVQGHSERDSELDFVAVQRGDPEMEQKVNRVIRACVEYGTENPILSIHDQGAGGNGNVLKELVEGEHGGAIINADSFNLGDPTMSIRELWGAEYQENNAILLDPSKVDIIQRIAQREKCPVLVVGRTTGDNRVVLTDYGSQSTENAPVNLDLTAISNRGKKVFHLKSVIHKTVPSTFPKNLTVYDVLNRVLRLPSVASKRFLTNKVDRSVSGLIVQQQCVGPLHTPIADVAVCALSYYDTVGAAVGVGEQPIKGMISAEVGARMSLAESLTNLVFAPISGIRDIKCSVNWMWAAKLDDEGARMVAACDSLCEAMKYLGVAIDGGKDSLSMAAQVENEIVKAPGTVVVSSYAPCTDINKVVTPNLKGSSVDTVPSRLIYVRFSNDGCSNRLGGSAMSQCFEQDIVDCSDLDDCETFIKAFNLVQKFVEDDRLLAGHDVSDGGLLICALEMAFAGNRSLVIQMCSKADLLDVLFAEECGVILEVDDKQVTDILKKFQLAGVFADCIGYTTADVGPLATVTVTVNGNTVLSKSLVELRSIWEDTSLHLEKLQTSAKCVKEQFDWLNTAKPVKYIADFDYSMPRIDFALPKSLKIYSVAILREEGSNGDREMAAAFHMVGFTPFDLTMTDLLKNDVNLNAFSGIAFVGGFSYGDVLGSAKGWASVIKFHDKVLWQLEHFRRRSNTFSLGVCNGCQLMAHLGWVGNVGNTTESGTIFMEENECGRFQSTFSTVTINKSPSIFLEGMEGAVLGVWSSHGEGRFSFRDDTYLNVIENEGLAPVRYCDGSGVPSMQFPDNPNGSARSIAAICSADGRHLAMMPHPDRSFLSWQWPDYPQKWRVDEDDQHSSPWIRLYSNAYRWVKKVCIAL